MVTKAFMVGKSASYWNTFLFDEKEYILVILGKILRNNKRLKFYWWCPPFTDKQKSYQVTKETKKSN